ncbi:MAG: flavin reductase family protein [Burkholderiaceae bacterium]|jgi:flavin reductase (DIM6/NTAB) family NADH-FMN oxidoreductase RutF|nr:flavin reductase family protein [Burkholderiaceae bacterium]MDP4968510.1 flavin reductase family protein [Burkholderiaceae bacterium]
MEIDITALPPIEQYKLLASTVVPRPIALVTTISDEFGDNAAPYSFFNCMGEDPPVMVLGLETKRHNQSLKDTTVNIRDNGQFVIHLIDEPMAQAMNICAIDFPSNISEVEEAGLTLTPSRIVRPKRIVEAPVAFECEKIALLQIGPTRNIAIGKVVRMHVRDGLFDPVTHYINPELYRPIGRMYGKLYARMTDHFEMEVPSYEAWQREKGF